jgi:prepilin-type N-terminal cleavage/methylation domain-containing protein
MKIFNGKTKNPVRKGEGFTPVEYRFRGNFDFSRNYSTGFTLIELLVVIAIIGILAGIVLASLSGAREKAKIARAKLEAKQIYNAIFMLENDTEKWPGHQPPNIICTDRPGGCPNNNELCYDPLASPNCTNRLSSGPAGLISNDSSDPYPNWAGPYLTAANLIDPWGNEYFFDTDYDIDHSPTVELNAVVIGSYGPNGRGNNDYDPDDVYYIIKQ